jgi:hypothetical protein
VTLTLCPGFKLLIPTFAPLPDGLGAIETFFLDAAAAGDVAFGLGSVALSMIVTFNFCPGKRF